MAVEGLTGERNQAPATESRNEQSLSPAPASADDALRAEVLRLAAENKRYREHAERTSKLFLAVTEYAESMRESARRDAELALRKARARVEQLEATARSLEQAERERARLQNELAELQAVIDDTRARLSAFLAAGLEALDTGEATGRQGAPGAGSASHLQEALHSRLASTSAAVPGASSEGVTTARAVATESMQR